MADLAAHARTPEDRAITARAVANMAAGLACVLAAWWVYVHNGDVFLLSSVDMGFHELGHLITSWAAPMVAAWAGSVTQLAVPLLLALYFGFIRRESYATALMLAWFGVSAHSVGTYIADAPYQALPLFGNGTHDWAYILGTAGHLSWAQPIAQGVFAVGLVALALGAIVATLPLLSPTMRARSASKSRAAWEAEQAQRRATLPRREPRNRPPAGPTSFRR